MIRERFTPKTYTHTHITRIHTIFIWIFWLHQTQEWFMTLLLDLYALTKSWYTSTIISKSFLPVSIPLWLAIIAWYWNGEKLPTIDVSVHRRNRNISSQIARFMGPTWGPLGADWTQVGLMWATRTLLSVYISMRNANTERGLFCVPNHQNEHIGYLPAWL